MSNPACLLAPPNPAHVLNCKVNTSARQVLLDHEGVVLISPLVPDVGQHFFVSITGVPLTQSLLRSKHHSFVITARLHRNNGSFLPPDLELGRTECSRLAYFSRAGTLRA